LAWNIGTTVMITSRDQQLMVSGTAAIIAHICRHGRGHYGAG
jgi:hypothetical protein